MLNYYFWVKDMIRIIICRFFEMLITCALISAIAVVLNITGLFTTMTSVFILALLGALCWFSINLYMLRDCYFDLRDNKSYYVSNYLAYAIFGVCTVVVYLCFSSSVYGWIFAITKFMKYTKLGISTVGATAIFHLLGGIMILLAPIGMKWIFTLEEDDELEEFENIENVEEFEIFEEY